MEEEVLRGGVANAGAVTRLGEHVLRPSNPHSRTIHRFLASLTAAGFNGASVPVGIDSDGRERLVFIDGEVPVAPYPAWAQRDESVASIAALMRRFHTASQAFDRSGSSWSDEMADPQGGPVVCHNDVCLENVVFRNGEAHALLDFDFAAPGRVEFDVASFARMCVPVDDDISAARLGFEPANRPARLRLIADAYGLNQAGRDLLVACLSEAIGSGGLFVARRVAAGDENFAKMWNEIGGMERFERRRRWWRHEMDRFVAALR